MRIAIKILEERLKDLKGQEENDVKRAINIIHDSLLNYDQEYINLDNIKKALFKLEKGKTIQNAEGYEYVAYFKKNNKYYTYYGTDTDKIREVRLSDIKYHIENHTLETNEPFF
jgi:hypothetical protein